MTNISLRDELAQEAIRVFMTEPGHDNPKAFGNDIADACLAVMARRFGTTPDRLENLKPQYDDRGRPYLRIRMMTKAQGHG